MLSSHSQESLGEGEKSTTRDQHEDEGNLPGEAEAMAAVQRHRERAQDEEGQRDGDGQTEQYHRGEQGQERVHQFQIPAEPVCPVLPPSGHRDPASVSQSEKRQDHQKQTGTAAGGKEEKREGESCAGDSEMVEEASAAEAVQGNALHVHHGWTCDRRGEETGGPTTWQALL